MTHYQSLAKVFNSLSEEDKQSYRRFIESILPPQQAAQYMAHMDSK